MEMDPNKIQLRKPYVFQASSTHTTESTASSTSGVTVIPNDPDPAQWIEDHPVLVSVIIIGGFLLILAFVLVWICYKRRKSQAKVVSSTIEKGESETTPTSRSDGNTLKSDHFSDSFVIIQSPSLSKRKESKPKRTLAVPPMFSVNQRKPSRPNNQRRATIHIAKWSDEGLEIREAGVLRDTLRSRTQSASSHAADANSARRPSTPAAGPSTSASLGIPKVYRRVSIGPHHSIYAPESFKPDKE